MERVLLPIKPRGPKEAALLDIYKEQLRCKDCSPERSPEDHNVWIWRFHKYDELKDLIKVALLLLKPTYNFDLTGPSDETLTKMRKEIPGVLVVDLV